MLIPAHHQATAVLDEPIGPACQTGVSWEGPTPVGEIKYDIVLLPHVLLLACKTETTACAHKLKGRILMLGLATLLVALPVWLGVCGRGIK